MDNSSNTDEIKLKLQFCHRSYCPADVINVGVGDLEECNCAVEDAVKAIEDLLIKAQIEALQNTLDPDRDIYNKHLGHVVARFEIELDIKTLQQQLTKNGDSDETA